MDPKYEKYSYIHQYHHPYPQYFDYWGQVYAHQQIWNLNFFSGKSYFQFEEQALKITSLPHPEILKREQFSDNEEEQKDVHQLTTRQKVMKQLQQQKDVNKDKEKEVNQQRQNRNVYSNVLRNFFRKLNDSSKIKELLRKIIKIRNLKLTAEEFVIYLKRLKINHGKYLRFKRLRHLFIDQKHKQHSMVFRILYQYYSKGELLVQTLTSRKIGRWSVFLHLKGARDLKRKIFY